LAGFLFEHRRGHCEFFAAAFAILLRAAGVPARVVGGFAGGAWDDVGGVVVFNESTAHAWVEWYAAGLGWVLDDATPLSNAVPMRLSGVAAWLERMSRSWDEYVLDYDLARQAELLRSTIDGLPRGPSLPRAADVRWVVIIATLLMTAALVVAWRRRRGASSRLRPLTRALLVACEGLVSSGTDEAATMRSLVRKALPATDAPGKATLRDALSAYERARFGAEVLPPLLERQLVRRLLVVSAARRA
jgi:protein-glutamine gamma-glutamyltransferase